jgi:hypothetical protein
MKFGTGLRRHRRLRVAVIHPPGWRFMSCCLVSTTAGQAAYANLSTSLE